MRRVKFLGVLGAAAIMAAAPTLAQPRLSAELSINYLGSSAERQSASFKPGITFSDSAWGSSLEAFGSYAETVGEKTDSRARISARQVLLPARSGSPVASALWEYDWTRGVSGRLQVFLGWKLDALRGARATLGCEASLGAERTLHYDASLDRGADYRASLQAYGSAVLDTTGAMLGFRLGYQPALDDPSRDFMWRGQVTLAAPVVSWLSVTLMYAAEYEKPWSHGDHVIDHIIIAGLRAEVSL